MVAVVFFSHLVGACSLLESLSGAAWLYCHGLVWLIQLHVFASIMHFWLIDQDFWSRLFNIRCKKYNKIVSSSQILILKFWLSCLAFNVESFCFLTQTCCFFCIEISSLCVLIMAQRVLTPIRHENTLVGFSKVKSESRWKQTVSSAPQFVPFYHTSVGRLGLEAKKEENLADWYSQVS